MVTTDNKKTAVLGRDEQQQKVWQQAYERLAVEIGYDREDCATAAGNEKGAVENLVKFVKGNILEGRYYYDDEDLEQDCAQRLEQVNNERQSAATQVTPQERLGEEQEAYGKLREVEEDYGF